MKRYIAFLTVALILIGVAWGGCVFGTAWYNLEEGDCVNDPLSVVNRIETINTVPCSEAYEWRVVSTFEVPRQQSYPGELFYERMAWESCDARYTDFLAQLEADWERSSQIRKVICLQNSFGLSVRDLARLDRLVGRNSLGINDCFREAPLTGYMLVEKVNCSDAEEAYQITHVFEITEWDSYPFKARLDRLALHQCPKPWDFYIPPDPKTWRVGDRIVQCMILLSQ